MTVGCKASATNLLFGSLYSFKPIILRRMYEQCFSQFDPFCTLEILHLTSILFLCTMNSDYLCSQYDIVR